MKTAAIPFDEELRLKDLWFHDIIDSPQDASFNGIVELAAQIADCPIALISFVDKDKQWFKAKKGIEECETSRDVSFCAHTIIEDDIFIVENALEDDRFFDNPLVTGTVQLRFYAGTPIYSSNGHKLGSICLIDHKPRVLNTEVINFLKILSNQITQLLDLSNKNKIIKEKADKLLSIEKEVARLNIQEQEKEREVIGNALQENFAQTLTASKLYLDLAEFSEENRLNYITKSKEQITKVLNNLRDLSSNMVPSIIQNVGLVEAVNSLICNYKATNNLSIELDISDNMPLLKNDFTLALYRIIQEQLKNIEQHAQATKVHIALYPLSQHVIQLEIKDNGNGFNLATISKGVGLNIIMSRAECFGGKIVVSSTPQNGCCLQAIMPVG